MLPLAAHTLGTLYRYSLPEALDSLAAAGYRRIELATTPPHAYTPTLTSSDIAGLRAQLRDLEMTCCSVTPTFLDLNIASPNEELRALSVRHVRGSMEVGAELGAEVVVLIPGRRHALIPQPADQVRAQMSRSLDDLVSASAALGVKIGLENFAAGIADTGKELGRLSEQYRGSVIVVFDVANAVGIEDPVQGLRDCGHHLGLVHVSDSSRAKWGHRRVGSGEVDFTGVASALRELNYRGVTVFELLQCDEPVADMASDAGKLEALGWLR